MKTIEEYIFEKFKISKNISDGNDTSVLDKYSYGMTCLILTTLYSPRIILIEIGKIIKFNKKSIVLENLTHFENKDKIIFKPDPRQGDKWKYILQTVSDNRTSILVPQDKIKDIIEFIKKNDNSLSFGDLLYDDKLNKETQIKRVGNRRWPSLKFSFLEHEDYEEIYKILDTLNEKS